MPDDPILATLGRLEEGQQRLEAGQGRLEDRIGRLEEGHQRLEAGQGRLEDRIGRLEEGQTQLRVDVMERADRLENAISDIRADIAVNMARAGRAILVNDNTRDEVKALQAEVSRMWLVIKRVEGRLP